MVKNGEFYSRAQKARDHYNKQGKYEHVKTIEELVYCVFCNADKFPIEIRIIRSSRERRSQEIIEEVFRRLKLEYKLKDGPYCRDYEFNGLSFLYQCWEKTSSKELKKESIVVENEKFYSLAQELRDEYEIQGKDTHKEVIEKIVKEEFHNGDKFPDYWSVPSHEMSRLRTPVKEVIGDMRKKGIKLSITSFWNKMLLVKKTNK